MLAMEPRGPMEPTALGTDGRAAFEEPFGFRPLGGILAEMPDFAEMPHTADSALAPDPVHDDGPMGRTHLLTKTPPSQRDEWMTAAAGVRERERERERERDP